MLKEAFVRYEIPVLAILVSVAASWALQKLASYLHAKAEAAQAEAKGSFQARALRAAEVLASCAADGVIRVENSLRPTIKEVTQDGKVTPEGAQRLRDEAIKLAWVQAKTCYPQVLNAGGFDMSSTPWVIEHLVETAAARLAGNSRAELQREQPPPSDPAPAAA